MSEGQLIRRLLPFERNFTQLPNSWLRDRKLSLKARGLLGLLMSHDDGFKVSIKALANDGNGGYAAISAAVVELEHAGYLIRRPRRRGGQFSADDWELCDPSGLSDPALIGYGLAGGPVDKSTVSENRRRSTVSENRGRTVGENRRPLRTLKNTKNSRPSPTQERAGSPVDNSERFAPSLSPADASAEVCHNGHPIIGRTPGGVTFCRYSCDPTAVELALPQEVAP